MKKVGTPAALAIDRARGGTLLPRVAIDGIRGGALSPRAPSSSGK
ncbi:MAG TPA: hypothetical protein VHH88_08810 [Verrucomicrobiae bacterium]|nr:hypothetical protein [Verrucomicrobiae bacterium]